MKTTVWFAGLGLLCVGTFVEQALAQPPTTSGPSLQPSRRPTVSPYLSLLGGNSAAGQYYRQVRPDFQFYQTSRDLQNVTRSLGNEIRATQQQLLEPRRLSDLTPTGYGAGFMTHQRYFNRFPAGPGGGYVGNRPTLRPQGLR